MENDIPMANINIEFKGGNPGAVQYGNFINYYQFHPPEKRINLLPTNIWDKNCPLYGLDLGCNSGDLTISLYNFLNNIVTDINILGLDIDPVLIERATEKNPYGHNLKYETLDFMDFDSEKHLKQYLSDHGLNKFSAIFCFSITMWIHLNNGDSGLRTFLQRICDLGQLIVIEPQPWKCYKSATKRMKSTNSEFPLFKELKIRQDIEEYIEKFLIEDCKMLKIYESTRTDWERKLLIFKHPSAI